MDWLRQIDAEKLLVFTLVLTRVSGLLSTAPVYGTQDVPMTVRALFSVILAVLVMPTQWGATLADPGGTLPYMALVGRDLAYGLSARGLAVNTAEDVGEEFPLFREFWIVHPAPGAKFVAKFPGSM